jgi:hypothetical protein
MFKRLSADLSAIQIFQNVTIAHDKGKPVVRQGRKATSLPERLILKDCRVAEGDLRKSRLQFFTIRRRRKKRVARYADQKVRRSSLQYPGIFGVFREMCFCVRSRARVIAQYLDRFFLFPQKSSVPDTKVAIRVCRNPHAAECSLDSGGVILLI